jgi:hypothetical protein
MNVVLTKEYNDTANSEELINATEYLTLIGDVLQNDVVVTQLVRGAFEN